MYAGNMPLFLIGFHICSMWCKTSCIKRYVQDVKKEGFKSYRYEECNESASEVIWVCDPNLGIPTELFGHGRW